jgi:hypothetical protein
MTVAWQCQNQNRAESIAETAAAGSTYPQSSSSPPAAQFQIDDDVFATGFFIPEDKWRERTNDGWIA